MINSGALLLAGSDFCALISFLLITQGEATGVYL